MTSFQTTSVTRQHPNHSDVITLERDGLQERWISARRKGPDELSVFDEFSSAPDNVVGQMVFGDRGYYDASRARMGGAD